MQKITFFERQKIELYIRCKWSMRRISRELGRHHSVISREMRRNKDSSGEYTSSLAQKMTDRRVKFGHRKKKKLVPYGELFFEVMKKIKLWLSPEQISWMLEISHETIYRFIYSEEGKQHGWFHYLRRARVKRQKRHARIPRISRIPHRTSIHERPMEINQKKTIGHWESDTMCFHKQKTALSVQKERLSQYVSITLMNDKSAKETDNAVARTFAHLPADVRKSITLDNGNEAVHHITWRKKYQLMTYFCDAFASWQKGGVENMNGLIRQFFPKNHDMRTVTQVDVSRVQDLLNNRPRKSLNKKSPNQLLNLRSGALGS